MTLVQNLTALRRKWIEECGGDRKYMIIENNKIILHVGDKCKHSFNFDDIQYIGYGFRDDKNIFRVFMSKDSSTNKGNDTETYYYNIFIYQNMEYECKNVSNFLKKLEENNIIVKRISDISKISNNIKNKKTFFLPSFHGWHIGEKQDELDGIIL